jgi:hypothetical protein
MVVHRLLKATVKRGCIGAALAAVVLLTSGHVGSPDTWYSGNAGPYRVLVHIKAPGVIPGVADVTVHVEGDEDIREVLANVNRFDAVAAAPPPERARPVRGEPNTYRVSLWVMTGGSNSFTVHVRGNRGDGAAVVPATVVAFRRLDFSGPLAWILGTMGVFLFAGLVTIVGSAVRESALPPGERPDARRRRTARVAMAGAAAVLALALFGGKKWWDSEDRAHRASMFQPLETRAEIEDGAQGRVLHFTISDTAWRRPNVTGAPGGSPRSRFSPLVPDHGKLMHMFLIAEDLSTLAHLHPETTDTVTFVTPLPDLPPGRYRIYGDITHESGYAQSLPSSVEISAPGADARATPGAEKTVIASRGDDSWFVGALAGADHRVVTLDERGVILTWLRPPGAPVRVGAPAPLRFTVTDAQGNPVELEPYMGMEAHAVIARADGGVFIHLHPMGTISAASQLAITMREPTDTVSGMLAERVARQDSLMVAHAEHMGHGASGAQNVLSFPYAFPSAGQYGIWVQVKHGGRVLTGAFAVEVEEGVTR